jgi:hypothetical protein
MLICGMAKHHREPSEMLVFVNPALIIEYAVLVSMLSLFIFCWMSRAVAMSSVVLPPTGCLPCVEGGTCALLPGVCLLRAAGC